MHGRSRFRAVLRGGALALLVAGCSQAAPRADAGTDVDWGDTGADGGDPDAGRPDAPRDAPEPDVQIGCCASDADCDDGDRCNGEETCSPDVLECCRAGTPPICAAGCDPGWGCIDGGGAPDAG